MSEAKLAIDADALIGQIRWDANGLVPTVVQDALSKEVLMLAYMNRESLRKTVESGETWFWSRSRGELWHKGATSGHTQRLVSLRYDCDGDALLAVVEQNGPACHTGSYTCFHRDASGGEPHRPRAGEDRFAPLSRLESVISQRYAERPEGAYTTYLFEKGIDKILKKVGEETAETIIAAKNSDNDELRYEASDLIFHLMVLLRERGLPLDEVPRELDSRHRPSKKPES